MAQTSLTPQKRTFDDPAKAREAGLKARRSGGKLAPEYRQLRQHQVVEMKLKGLTTQQIADHFGLHYTTIDQDLKTIKRDGLLEKFERKILGRLMPKVVTKLERLLDKDDDNLEPVKEVMKFFTGSHQHKFEREQMAEGGQREDSFEAWVREWQAKREDTTPPAGVIDTEEIAVESAGVVSTSGTSQAPDGDEAAGEARPDASGPERSWAVVRISAEEIAASVGSRASQIGLAVGRTAEAGAAAVHEDRRSEPETAR